MRQFNYIPSMHEKIPEVIFLCIAVARKTNCTVEVNINDMILVIKGDDTVKEHMDFYRSCIDARNAPRPDPTQIGH